MVGLVLVWVRAPAAHTLTSESGGQAALPVSLPVSPSSGSPLLMRVQNQGQTGCPIRWGVRGAQALVKEQSGAGLGDRVQSRDSSEELPEPRLDPGPVGQGGPLLEQEHGSV